MSFITTKFQDTLNRATVIHSYYELIFLKNWNVGDVFYAPYAFKAQW
jgi:hypothetical protein